MRLRFSTAMRGGLAIASVGFAVIACLLLTWDSVWAVGKTVLHPTQLAGVVFGVAVALGAAAIAGPALTGRGQRSGSARFLLVACALAIALVSSGTVIGGALLLTALSDLTESSSDTRLEPPDHDGCVVVVRERSGLLESSGQAYVVDASGLGTPAGSWTVHDPGHPVHDGRAVETFGPGRTSILIPAGHGATGSRIRFEVSCPRP